eukprot:12091-Heterococcus_DN1.PRE.4
MRASIVCQRASRQCVRALARRRAPCSAAPSQILMLKPARSFFAEQYSLQQQQQRGLASCSGLDYSTLSTPPGSPLHDQIMESAAMRQTGVSLKTLIDTGRGELLGGDIVFRESDLTTREQMLIQVASFLHRELPIRLAHRVRDLESVPDMLQQKSVKQVREWYVQSYDDIKQCPAPKTRAVEAKFAKLLQDIYARHAPVLLTMARGVWELRESFKGTKDNINERMHVIAIAVRSASEHLLHCTIAAPQCAQAATQAVALTLLHCCPFAWYTNMQFYDFDRLHNFLDGFYMSRIGIRILILHYLALRESHDGLGGHGSTWIGAVCQETSPNAILAAAIEDAKWVCTRQYGDAPDVTIHGRLDLAFSYVPDQHCTAIACSGVSMSSSVSELSEQLKPLMLHLHYIMMELLKNSMRATVEFHGLDEMDMYPIRIVIADGEDVSTC